MCFVLYLQRIIIQSPCSGHDIKIIHSALYIIIVLNYLCIMASHTCSKCLKLFPTMRGKNIHLSRCTGAHSSMPTSNIIDSSSDVGTIEPPKAYNVILNGREIQPFLPEIQITPIANPIKTDFINIINSAYEEVVFFKRNLFNVPSGTSGKNFINELTFWIRQFNTSTKLNSIALKAFMIIPSLMLQKPSSKSKAKEHAECLNRRLEFWKKGEIACILQEAKLIQRRLLSSKKPKSSEDISRIFAKLMMEGKISAALKFLDSESSGGVLPISNNVLEDLKSKHPKPEPILEESLLFGPHKYISPHSYISIDEQSVLLSALKTKGSAGPSGMDAEIYRRILCSKNFSAAGKSLREEIATLTKNLLTQSYHPSLIEPFVSSPALSP